MSLRPVKVKKPKQRRMGYANLHWRRETSVELKTISLRTKIIAITAIVLLFILAIGRYDVVQPVYAVDWNSASISHTRTPIFNYTTTDEIIYTSLASYDGAKDTTKLGFLCIPACPSNNDITGQCIVISTSEVAKIFRTKFWLAAPGGAGTPTATITSRIYASSGTAGSGCIGTGSSLASSDTLSVSPSNVGATFTQFSWNMSGFSLALNTAYVFVLEMDSCTNCASNRFIRVAGSTSGGPSSSNEAHRQGGVWVALADQDLYFDILGTTPTISSNVSNVRWNFNATCVEIVKATVSFIRFHYGTNPLGTGGSNNTNNPNPGVNCNSQDIAITKAPINLQTVSGRQLEATFALSYDGGTQLKNFRVIFRTNGTLPGFNEKYDASSDKQARLIWEACPTYICTSGTNSLYIVHDQSKSLNDETKPNDLVIQGSATDFTSGASQPQFQFVLNFTGPNNYICEVVTTNDCLTKSANTNLAGSLQQGADYYIMLQASFDTNLTPNSFVRFVFPTSLGNPALPKTFQIFSVPTICTDPLNAQSATCNTLNKPQPVFDINPLDPSSWGNAIIKGLTWIFVSAIPQFVTFIIQGTLLSMQIILNVVGNFFGWGNVGDTLISWINQLVTFFSTSMSQLVAQLSSLFSPVLNITTFLLTFFASGPISGFITAALSTGVATVSLVVSIVLRVVLFLALAYGLMEILLWFVYCADFGLAGYQAWIETSKWLLFGTGIKVLIHFFNFGLDIITALIGLIPKPFIQMIAHRFPRIPIVDISGYPTWPRFDMQALCDLDLFALLGIGVGAIFLIQYETTNLPGTIASVSNIQMNYSGFINLFLVFASVGGVIILISMPAKMAMAFAKCIELIGGRVAVGGLSPSTRTSFAEIGETVKEKVVPSKPGKVRVAAKRGGKRFQKGLERRIEKTKAAREFTERVRQAGFVVEKGKTLKPPTEFQRQELRRLVEQAREQARGEQEEQRRRQEQQQAQQRRAEINVREDIARQLERNE